MSLPFGILLSTVYNTPISEWGLSKRAVEYTDVFQQVWLPGSPLLPAIVWLGGSEGGSGGVAAAAGV